MSDSQPFQGIVDFKGPSGSNAGIFQLPLDFDQKQFASNWVLKGPDVEKAQQTQPILGTNKGATGWSIWKYPKDHKQGGKPHTTATSKGDYVLMFRPRSVQDSVNALYGNVSKRHLVRTQLESIPVAPGAGADASVLPHARLEQSGIRDFGDDYVMNVSQNPESSAAKVEADPVVVGTAQTQTETESDD